MPAQFFTPTNAHTKPFFFLILVLIHRAFLHYRQSPTNAQTINKGINQPFIIIKTLHMFL
jgi:hypothetical protein